MAFIGIDEYRPEMRDMSQEVNKESTTRWCLSIGIVALHETMEDGRRGRQLLIEVSRMLSVCHFIAVIPRPVRDAYISYTCQILQL